ITTEWNNFPHNGTISTSPWVILVRDGNPKEIHDFADLARKDIDLVHADPTTSGGACWSIFSIYGSELRSTGNASDAEGLLDDIMNNVISWQSSARSALSQFMLGYGDALITYENDALLAVEKGEAVEIVYPASTIYSEHKVVMVDRNVNEDELELIEGFIDLLFTKEVQGHFIENGFRGPDITSDTISPSITDPFTVEYLGGWEEAHEHLIDDLYVNIRKGGT
ncbi:MAG: substrate-binding domain-containing protein, partial [Thermoplasmata archaeon]|nr:substrate-binding domain-containing protein [Thermoplasmata archaeon]